MAKAKNSPFRLDRVIIKSFSIEREPVDEGKLNIKITPSGYINKDIRNFLLTLDVFITDSNDSFKINTEALGYFEYQDVDGEENLDSYFYTNAPALVFPYIRSYISAVSALSGLNAIHIPLMNLSNLKNELKGNVTDISVSSRSSN